MLVETVALSATVCILGITQIIQAVRIQSLNRTRGNNLAASLKVKEGKRIVEHKKQIEIAREIRYKYLGINLSDEDFKYPEFYTSNREEIKVYETQQYLDYDYVQNYDMKTHYLLNYITNL